MSSCDKFHWSTSDINQQLQIARAAGTDELRRLARCYDWSTHPETVLSWIMAQKGMDLATALTVFFNGGPERFNYIAKHEVPPGHRGAARVLDNICQRMNSGFYRVRPGQRVAHRARVERWLAYQQADREDGRRGRWILDEAIVDAALKGRPPQAAGAMRDAEALRPLRGGGPAHTLWSRLVAGGPARQLRRFLPSRGS